MNQYKKDQLINWTLKAAIVVVGVIAAVSLLILFNQYQVAQAATTTYRSSTHFVSPTNVDTVATRYAQFNEKSKSTKIAKELETFEEVNSYIWSHISYDDEKAAELVGTTAAYYPNPDEILESGKGICLDFASVTAAMFRSKGISCKIAVGDVTRADGSIEYHAWNEVCIDGEWLLVDNTFKAANPSYIADPSDYVVSGYI